MISRTEIFLKNFLYYLGATLGLPCLEALSSCAGLLSCGAQLLTAVALLLAEHRLSVRGALASAVVVQRFSASWHVGSSQTGDLNLCPLHWQAGG